MGIGAGETCTGQRTYSGHSQSGFLGAQYFSGHPSHLSSPGLLVGEKGGWEFRGVGRILLAKQIIVVQRNDFGVKPSRNTTNSAV